MFIELPINNGSKTHRAFLSDNFFHPAVFSSILHKHDYTECHAVIGTATYQIEKETYTLTNGDVLLIPKGEIHYCTFVAPNSLRISFQIDLNINTTCVKNVGDVLLKSLLNEIKSCQKSGRYTGVAGYISLICDAFEIDVPLNPIPISDYGFLIREFFSLRYTENVSLSDLADILHLSERQTERRVFIHTGNSFRKELIETRMRTAQHLRETTDMSLAAIAKYVGYSSYPGFWKAFQQYQAKK